MNNKQYEHNCKQDGVVPHEEDAVKAELLEACKEIKTAFLEGNEPDKSRALAMVLEAIAKAESEAK